MADASMTYDGPALPIGSKGHLSSGWWGMLALVATEAALFAYLLFSTFYLQAQQLGAWPPDGLPSLKIAVPDTVLLLLASGTMWWGERGIRRGRQGRLMAGLALTLVLGAVFLGLQVMEWQHQPFSLSTHVYGSLYFTVTGFHMAHVAVGLVMIATLLVWAALGHFGAPRHSPVSIGAIYWHFVTVVWIAVFLTFYVAPYLSRP